ncbi:MAG TPA: GerMN domain-containing protein [Pyrinomonadaceae bacterium]
MKLLSFLLFMFLAFGSAGFAQKPETMTIKVYFHPDKLDPEWDDCKKVAPVTRTVPRTRAVATAALQELLKGPTAEEAKEYSGFRPPETNGILKRVTVKNGAAYVNFTKAVYAQMGNATSSCGGGFFSMVDATLMQFPTIKNVYYAIEGSTNDFYEWVQVGECPYSKKICASSNFR